VKGTQEATLDSAFLVMASNMSAIKARSMKTTAGAFDVEDFIEKLISFMGGNQATEEPTEDGVEVDNTASLKWDKIGRKALAKSRRSPVMDFM
jgi:non-structural maintenance of chromosomes element 4